MPSSDDGRSGSDDDDENDDDVEDEDDDDEERDPESYYWDKSELKVRARSGSAIHRHAVACADAMLAHTTCGCSC